MSKKILRCRELFLIGILFSGSAYPAAVYVELTPYSKATYLVNIGRNTQASERWHQLTITFLSSESKLGRQNMWQHAGLSEALAAIAADRENNAIAYQYWADSTRYLMTGGTNWEQMRKKLHLRYERANRQLSTQLHVTDLAVSFDDEWQKELSILQVWDEKLAIFSFQSPKLGLRDNTNIELDIMPTPHGQLMDIYEPRSGGSKLSGLNTEFKQEMHLIPVETKSDDKSIENSINTKKIVTEQNQEKKQVQNALHPNNKSESIISRHLIIDISNESLEVLPKLSKSINITNGADTSKQASFNDERLNNDNLQDDKQSVIITPINEFQYLEKQMNTVQSGEDRNNSDYEPVSSGDEGKITPVIRGKLVGGEEQGIEARQRRTFVPIKPPKDE
ncbi:hypothetical protein [uncultured Photobacterium sp.]|uniref:hypothetical protein n=1 Tax=uncultured Photobacterium sp. TaxID=173973 RepID=UPI0026280896|nr:hypothetical protein [uncultured Photobacterium sp.]